MFIRRLLALLCSLFLAFCVVWPGAYAVEVPDLDDLDIDPWGDLGLIQETPEPAPTVPIGEPALQDPVQLEPAGEGEDVYSLEQDAGIMMTSGEDIGLMGVKFQFYSGAFDGKVHSQFVVGSGSSNSHYFVRNLIWYDYSIYQGTENRAPRLHYIENFSNSSFYGNVLYRNYPNSGFLLHFSNLSVNAGNTPRFVIYGKLLANLQIYDYWYANNKYWFGEFPSYKISPVTASYSFDGSSWTAFTDDEYNSQTGEFNFSSDLERSFTDIYIKLDYPSYPGGNNPQVLSISTPGTGISSTKTYFFFELDHTQFHIEGSAASGGVDEETKGLLATIIQWLTSIRDGIVNVASSIAQLPGKIANLIIDGIKSLFIPSEDDLNGLKDQYETLLSERLGFIWQAGEMVISFGQSVLSAFETSTNFQFEFPGVSFELPELGQVTLIEPQVVSVDNAFMDVMQPVLGTIVSFICVLAFINTAERMVVAVVSGISYFHFLKGD